MGRFSKYPYTDFSNLNLDWMLQRMREVEAELQRYLDNSVITFADPITWDITEQYTALTVVVDSDGTAYLSKQPVPSGVAITNTNYWLPIFNYDDNINELRAQIAYNAQTSATTGVALATGDLVFWNGIIYKVLTDMPAGTAFIEGTNVTPYTVDTKINDLQTEIDNLPDYSTDITNLQNEDINLQGQISQEVLDRSAADANIQSQIDALATATHFYDTVADMKAATPNIGSICMTSGYYNVNDGGSAFYRIHSSLPTGYYEVLNNGSYAAILNTGEFNVKQFGAQGDGTHDDTAAINNALAQHGVINFNEGTYLIDSSIYLNVQSNSIINGNNATINMIPTDQGSYGILALSSVENVLISDLVINGDRNDHTGATGEWGHGVSIMDCKNVVLKNLTINNCWGDGLYVGGYTVASSNVLIDNIYSYNNRRNGISIVKGVDITVQNSKFYNTNGTAPEAGIAVESNSIDDALSRIKFINCFSAYNNGTLGAYASMHRGGDVSFINCTITNVGKTGLAFTVLGAAAQACVFNATNCAITASVPFVLSGINQNSGVTIHDCDLYRVTITPFRFTGSTTNECRNIVADVNIISSTVTEGALIALTSVYNSDLTIKFIGCDVTDPRTFGSGNIDLATVNVRLSTTIPKTITGAVGTYYQVGASNPEVILTSYSGTVNALSATVIPRGTRYKIINRSGYGQYIRQLPNHAITGLTNDGIPNNAVCEFERADATSITGICYTLP